MPLGHCTKATTMAQDAGINHSQPHVAAAVVLQKQPTKVHPPTRNTRVVSGRISLAGPPCVKSSLHWHYTGCFILLQEVAFNYPASW